MSGHSPGKENKSPECYSEYKWKQVEEGSPGRKEDQNVCDSSVCECIFFFRDHQLGSRLEEQRVENKHRERGDQQRGLHGTGETCPRHGHSVGECLLRGPSSSASQDSRGSVSGPVTSVNSFP